MPTGGGNLVWRSWGWLVAEVSLSRSLEDEPDLTRQSEG